MSSVFFFSRAAPEEARESWRRITRGEGPDKNKPLVLWMWMTARREGSTSNVRTERRWAAEEQEERKKQEEVLSSTEEEDEVRRGQQREVGMRTEVGW